MKRTLFAAGMALWIAGCGNDLVVTTLAEARATCDTEFGIPFTDNEWNTLLILSQTARDAGLSKFDAIQAALACGETTDLDEGACRICLTAMVDAVWSDR